MANTFAIRAVGFANGSPCPHEDQWVESFDHDACGGQGYGTFTGQPSKAMLFDSYMDAMAFWNKRSALKPLRPDGKPNRPLTALTMTIEKLG
jgi:hypothetical protein